MHKKVLSEQCLYYGIVSMPKGFEINKKELIHYVLHTDLTKEKWPFSRTWDMLNTYLREHIHVKFKTCIVNKETWGNIYKPLEKKFVLSNTNPVDLKSSPDFTLLYGLKTQDCTVSIQYDDNRRKGRKWNIPLEEDKFIMFPATNTYTITNNQKESLNFVLTITYESI